MRLSQLVALTLATAFALVSCGEDEVDIREGARGMLADSAVLQAMRSSDSGGRIIYAAAPDLSLASARQRRPDIFRPPTPAKPVPQRDTTEAGDTTRRARQP
jgi:hypothetical protein